MTEFRSSKVYAVGPFQTVTLNIELARGG